MEQNPTDGSFIRWGQQCRIRHMCTRRYLRLTKEGDISLTVIGFRDPLCVFRIFPAIEQDEKEIFVETDDYCRIQHAVSGSWIRGDQAPYESKSRQRSDETESLMASLVLSKTNLKKIIARKERQYDDVFALQIVKPEDHSNFNFMAGMVPTLKVLKNRVFLI